MTRVIIVAFVCFLGGWSFQPAPASLSALQSAAAAQGWAGTPPSPEAPLEPRAPATVNEGEMWIPPLPAMESVAPPAGWVTSGPDVPPMPLTLLRLPRTNITRAKFPAIDFHVHARELTTPAAYRSLVTLMDSIGMGAIANMNGGTGQALDAALKAGEAYRDRVATFVTFDPDGINQPGWSQRFAAEMERGFTAGALGLKVHKTLGQVVKNPDGSFIQADDPRLDPIWAMAAKHNRPVMIHISDSIGRFYPIGPKNERYEAGLWRRPGDTSENLFRDGPRPDVIEQARENMHRKHPKTRFVNAHMAMLYYDPQKLATFLDTYPNADVEISATLQDLGRAPRLWREFLINYQDRILMGSDGSPSRGADEFWIPHWRYLETYDEYFYHPAQIRTPGGSPGHGRWNISGIGLPDAVLRKIYYQNALRHLPSLRPSIERQLAARQNRAAGVTAVPEPKSTIVPRIAGDVKIDGVLDEGPWQKAARVTPFVQHDTMAAARVDTEVRVWYDHAALYLGWICEDGDIQATFTARDSRFWEEEVVEFFVTPGALDRYVELQWNPLGGTFDAIITNEIAADGRSRRFEGDWSYTATNMTYAARVAGSVQNSNDRDQRWTVEVRIPFADLNVRTPERGDIWRANFYRFNRDHNREPELLSWSPTIWPGFHQPTRFGYLRFSGE